MSEQSVERIHRVAETALIRIIGKNTHDLIRRDNESGYAYLYDSGSFIVGVVNHLHRTDIRISGTTGISAESDRPLSIALDVSNISEADLVKLEELFLTPLNSKDDAPLAA